MKGHKDSQVFDRLYLRIDFMVNNLLPQWFNAGA
jgi:hypothetical protein